MFDIGWSELLVIGVVALIAIGPKELPGVLRALGQWMTKIRSMASEFQGQFQEAMREAEMADLKKEVDNLSSSFDTPFDPSKALDSNWTPDSTPSSATTPEPLAPELTPADAAVPPADAPVPSPDPEPTPAIPEPVAAEPPGPPAESQQSAEAGKP